MFLHLLVTCRRASTHLGYVREALERDVHVPFLWIEGDIVDFTLFDPEEALRKAEAFEETMEHCRDKRLQAGAYAWTVGDPPPSQSFGLMKRWLDSVPWVPMHP